MRRSIGRGLETGALCTAPALDPTSWRQWSRRSRARKSNRVEARAPTTDVVATLNANLEKALPKAPPK
jgi:hypothetical protein